VDVDVHGFTAATRTQGSSIISPIHQLDPEWPANIKSCACMSRTLTRNLTTILCNRNSLRSAAAIARVNHRPFASTTLRLFTTSNYNMNVLNILGFEKVPAGAKGKSFYDLKAPLPGSKGDFDFANLKGKAVLIVNTASKW
jgi:hypothetical protein